METEARLRSTGTTTFVLCYLTALVEGFDLLAAGVTAPRFGAEFMIAPGYMGWIFSANTLGLFFGAAVGGRLSDRLGRKKTLIASMLLFGACTLGTAFASSAEMILWSRLLTGMGLGAAMPNLIAMTAEAKVGAKQTTYVTIMASGMPAGGVIAALLAYFIGTAMDWRVMFHLGGWVPVLLAIVMLAKLPGTEYRPLIGETSDPATTASGKVGVLGALFGEGRAPSTLLLWTSFFFTMIIVYLMLNWLPTLLIGMGFDLSKASLVNLSFAAGNALGALLFGLLIASWSPSSVLVTGFIGMVCGIVTMASIGSSLPTALVACFVTGFFIAGAQFLLYGLSPSFYPGKIRATGVGWAVAIGRLGAVAGPLIAGTILSAGYGTVGVMLGILPVIFVAFVASMILTRRKSNEPGQASHKLPVSAPSGQQ